MTENQAKPRKRAVATTVDLTGEDITTLDDAAVESMLQEALAEAVDSAVTHERERASVDDVADEDSGEPAAGVPSEVGELEEIPIDLLAPVEGLSDGLEILPAGGGAMLLEEDPDLAFPDLDDDLEKEEPGPAPIPDEVLEELEILRERVDELSDAEQAAALERRSLLDANESLRAQNEVYKSRLIKLNDEFEAYRRRVERDRAETVRRETERVVRTVLPVVDHMELALEHAKANPQGKGLLEGFELILAQFHKALIGLGVSTVRVEAGQPFDPNLHDAVMREPVEGVEPNRVTRGLRTGYLLGDRLLRAARVAVAEGPSVDDDPTPDTDGDEEEGDTTAPADPADEETVAAPDGEPATVGDGAGAGEGPADGTDAEEDVEDEGTPEESPAQPEKAGEPAGEPDRAAEAESSDEPRSPGKGGARPGDKKVAAKKKRGGGGKTRKRSGKSGNSRST